MIDLAIKLFEKGGITAALFVFLIWTFREAWKKNQSLHKQMIELQEKRLEDVRHITEVVMHDAQRQRQTMEAMREAIEALAKFVERVAR